MVFRIDFWNSKEECLQKLLPILSINRNAFRILSVHKQQQQLTMPNARLIQSPILSSENVIALNESLLYLWCSLLYFHLHLNNRMKTCVVIVTF